jgi:hypothetical protein
MGGQAADAAPDAKTGGTPSFATAPAAFLDSPAPPVPQVDNPWKRGLWLVSPGVLVLGVMLGGLIDVAFFTVLGNALGVAGGVGIVAASVLSALDWRSRNPISPG